MSLEQLIVALQKKEYDLIDKYGTLDILESLYYDQQKYEECTLFTMIKMVSLNNKIQSIKNAKEKKKLEEEYQEYYIYFSQNSLGIISLIQKRNEYFLKYFSSFLNRSFFMTSHYDSDDFIYFLYQNGFDKEVKKYLYDINLMDLRGFFNHVEIRDSFFSKALAIRLNRIHSLFYALPKDKLGLLAYCEYDWFSKDTLHNQKKMNEETLNILRDLYHNNFDEILDYSLQEKLLSLYGNVSSEVIFFAIESTITQKEQFWLDLEKCSAVYFEYDLYRCLKFVVMYPSFFKTLLTPINFTNEELKQQIYLLEQTVALNIKSLSEQNEDAKFAFSNVEGSIPSWAGLVNDLDVSSLFSYDQELIILKFDGEVFEVEVTKSHMMTLQNFYGQPDQNEYALLYEKCLEGDIIIFVEHGAIQYFMPPTLNSIQKAKILNDLERFQKQGLEANIMIGCSYAILDHELEFVSLNQQDVMTLKGFQKSLDYFLIDEEGKYLNLSDSKRLG